ncbi:hypothetical protein F53441_8090 [Fusarium austroafricanum]|uniref:Uncharacterized protein n=1 Tax=Fusarium austroafricanum TaxID=2364996 RepID=A0A8H4KEY4_9HYPO|nr:hypothetical protein F53441_8090 [Fusarium austroafricanum]
MAFDCGFDIFPHLTPTAENKLHYQRFLCDLTSIFKSPNSNTHYLILPTDADRPKTLSDKFIHVLIAGEPKIPVDPDHCDCFLSLRSSTTFHPEVHNIVKEMSNIARHHFGGRVHFWVDKSDVYSAGELRRAEDQVVAKDAEKNTIV